jgi:hypothetical protein
MVTIKRLKEIIKEDKENNGVTYQSQAEWEGVMKLALLGAQSLRKKPKKKK